MRALGVHMLRETTHQVHVSLSVNVTYVLFVVCWVYSVSAVRAP